MTRPAAFFLPRPGASDALESFTSTELTRGPWDPHHQHGGPCAGLLARAVERRLAELDSPTALVARLTVELLRPIPITPVAVTAELVRAGRQVHRVRASVTAGDAELARATALGIASRELPLPDPPREPDLPPPEQSRPFEFPFFDEELGYHAAMELRAARGTWGTGRMALWMRMRYPLVQGEDPSPLQRVVVAADSGNGVSVALDLARYTFVNPDLTVYLHRPPAGEWICLDARTTPEPNGLGLAESALSDARGPIGRSLQSLVVAERSG